jgi:hypothetical protein
LDEQYESTIIYSDGANWIQLATGGGGGASSDLIEHTHTGSTDGGLLRLDTISAPTDSTSLDASTNAHGLLPKLSGTATEYMNGTGAWSTPAGGSSDLAEHTHASSDTGGLIRLDTITAPTDSTSLNASKDMHGLLPKLSGSSDEYMNGIGEWGTPAGGGGGASSDLIEHGHTGAADGGAIKLDDLQPPDDTTDLDASTDAHGLLPKLPGTTNQYLRSDGAFASLPSPTTITSGVVMRLDTSEFIAGTTDASSGYKFISQNDFNALMRSGTTDFDASTDTHGFLPKLSGTATEFLDGTGAWSTPVDIPGASIDPWVPSADTWSYSSSDSPTFVASVNADVTGLIGVGYRVKLTQTTVKYFIVTAVGAYSGGATLLTLYGGTDYTLTDEAISDPSYSYAKAPLGFPMSPSKWTVEVTDANLRSQETPTQNAWYNWVNIVIPLGLWRVYYEAIPSMYKELAAVTTQITLSTANNSESDTGFTSGSIGYHNSTSQVHQEKILELAAKATYYLNIRTIDATVLGIYIRGDRAITVIRAVCAYL